MGTARIELLNIIVRDEAAGLPLINIYMIIVIMHQVSIVVTLYDGDVYIR